MSSYKTIEDVVSDLNVMITEAPLPNKIKCELADIVGELEQLTETVRSHLTEKGANFYLVG